ncbi:hypothetical protein [Pseudonocardia sp. ICBG162]|uniref:hypothetical protein n=1 Tax=Pseudonocardia sp. ICBG162 TaxID=2846761 RepID=UPI001CF6A587|nr:hypothetical protein [Pseudonocardia sp. ICBG162]
MSRDTAVRPEPTRHRGSAAGILTSALAGSGLVAGHVALSGDAVHVEDLALQAFVTPAGESLPSPATRLPAATAPAPSDGAVRALAEPPPIDVDAIAGAATSAVDEAVQAGRDAQGLDDAEDQERGGAGGGPSSCAAGTEGFGGVADGTAIAGEALRCMFGVDTVYGVAGRANASDHPKGKALDFMVDRATGERLAEYARQNMDELGISYVIYRQRIDTGSGWEQQEDRGGTTANHMDHVHVSFD